MTQNEHHNKHPDRTTYEQQPNHKKPIHIGLVEATWATSGVLVILGGLLAMSASPKLKLIAVWVFVAAIVIGSIAAGVRLTHELLDSHGNTPPTNLDNKANTALEAPSPTPMKDDKPNINISSTNQSGGFTGYNTGTVNLAPGPRHVSPEQRQTLLSRLKPSPGMDFVISYGVGEKEQKEFAEEIISILHEAGYTPEVSSAVILGTPHDERGITVEVSKKPPYPSGSDVLQQAFNEAKIEMNWVGGETIAAGRIWMIIGKNR